MDAILIEVYESLISLERFGNVRGGAKVYSEYVTCLVATWAAWGGQKPKPIMISTLNGEHKRH